MPVRIWITEGALANEGVIVVDVPDDVFARGCKTNSGALELPREVLAPWRGRDIFLTRTFYSWDWHRSEADARKAVAAMIEKRRNGLRRDLKRVEEQRAAFKANGMPYAQTIAEKKAARPVRPRRERQPSGLPDYEAQRQAVHAARA